ncbi:MAG TPA: hypothetical protein VEY91_11675 [Candidatus Limnocylindria bacterium]|nr:hypothetical protein [Candidatus Limnocylindria bacterium]
MRQGRKFVPVCLALAIAVMAGATLAVTAPVVASEKKVAAPAKSAKARNAMHQFTGIVTASDKSTLTVEKRGKKPRTVVFTKHEEMKTVGEIEKDARVTVYYRDEGGRTIAHRVIVKPDAAGSRG